MSFNDNNNSFAVSEHSFIGFIMNYLWIKRREIFPPICFRLIYSTLPIVCMCWVECFLTAHSKFVNIESVGQTDTSNWINAKKSHQTTLINVCNYNMHIDRRVFSLYASQQQQHQQNIVLKNKKNEKIGNGFSSLY